MSIEAVKLKISKTDTETLFELSSKGHLTQTIERPTSFFVAWIRKQNNGSSCYAVLYVLFGYDSPWMCDAFKRAAKNGLKQVFNKNIKMAGKIM